MRTVALKGLLLVLAFIGTHCCFLAKADSGLITKQVTVTLDEAGTLPNKIGSDQKYKITNLKVVGEINGTDVRLIRNMAGIIYHPDTCRGKLTTLDLSEAKIVRGGMSYDNDGEYSYDTGDNEIGDYFFYGSSLTNLKLPEGLVSIGNCAFQYCRALKSLEIPSSVKSIGNCAFFDCTSLTSVEIPSEGANLGKEVFYGCSSLSYLYINRDTPLSITETFFRDVDKTKCLLYVPMDAYEKYHTANLWSNFSHIVEYDHVLQRMYVRSDRTGYLNSLIESSKKYNLLSFKVSGDLNGFDFEAIREMAGRNVYGKATKGKLRVLDLSEAKIVTASGAPYYCDVDNDYQYFTTTENELGHYIFQGCESLVSVKLPSTITYIGSSAFYHCDNLRSVVIPSSVTSIGDYAFESCEALPGVVIPSSVTSLGCDVFGGCGSLRFLYVGENVPSAYNSFMSYAGFSIATLYVPTGATQKYASSKFWLSFGHVEEYEGDPYLLALTNRLETIKTYLERVIGDGALQVAPKFVNKAEAEYLNLVEAWNAAESDVKNAASVSSDKIKDDIATLEISTKSFIDRYIKGSNLNVPSEECKLNVVLVDKKGWDEGSGNAFTAKANCDVSSGYSVDYLQPAGSPYLQALSLKAVDGVTDTYYMNFTTIDGTKLYVANSNWLISKEKPVPVKIELETTDLAQTAVYHLAAVSNGEFSYFRDVKGYTAEFQIAEAVNATAPLKVTDAKWGTFIAPFDAEIPQGVKAYSCSAADADNALLLVEQDAFKANTPYILYAESPVEVNLMGYGCAETATYTDGALTGTFENITDVGQAQNRYVLQKQTLDGEVRVAFFPVNADNVWCNAYRAYLTLSDAQGASFRLVAPDVTGIGQSHTLLPEVKETARYNAAGMLLTFSAKGVNIVKLSNGRIVKQIVK